LAATDERCCLDLARIWTRNVQDIVGNSSKLIGQDVDATYDDDDARRSGNFSHDHSRVRRLALAVVFEGENLGVVPSDAEGEHRGCFLRDIFDRIGVCLEVFGVGNDKSENDGKTVLQMMLGAAGFPDSAAGKERDNFFGKAHARGTRSCS
jgi:hypothetical protein